MTDNKDKTTENSYSQAADVLKALSHYESPKDASQIHAWLEETKPLQSLIRTLCRRDRTGYVTLDCVQVLFDLIGTQGEDVSPAIWGVLDIVDQDDLKYLFEKFLKNETLRLNNSLLALLSGVCTYGPRVPMLEIWCHAFIEALENKEKYSVLLSVSRGVALRLLNGIIFPYSRKVAFSLLERLLYPMTNPHVFNLIIDHIFEVIPAVVEDEIWDKFRGLIKTLLVRFPPEGREETYSIISTALGKFSEKKYKPGYTIWNQKPKTLCNLATLLECPVCYERFVIPITACENGHCICNNCNNQLKNCPICRGDISKIRMSIMDHIMDITKFRCKNFDAGCEVKLLYKDIWNHELRCDYRTVSCDIITNQNPAKLICNKDVVVTHFHEHIEKCHKTFVIPFQLNEKHRGEVRRAKTNEVKLLKSAAGNFIERIFVTEEEIFFSYHYVGKSEEAKDYVYTLVIDSGGIPQKIRYTNFCLSNYMGVLDTEINERCLVLEPEKVFSPQQSKLQYSVRIEETNAYRMRLKKNKFLVLS